jgi:hypothetical protein
VEGTGGWRIFYNKGLHPHIFNISRYC